jgi:hypothetical protein
MFFWDNNTFFKKAVFVNFVASREVVDFRSRMLAFRGVSPVPLLPQESRTFRSNQLFYQWFIFTRPIDKNNHLL